jgi:CubicO group peptidase (beta-lactamase class C family)
VSKLISSVAFMNLIRETPIAAGTVNQQLDTEIIGYLPEGLQTRFRNKLNGVTFRHLLLHKSGLRGFQRDDDFEPTGDRTTLEHALALGATNPGNDYQYNNENISLMRFFIPHIAYPDQAAAIHEARRNKSGTAYFDAVRDDYQILLTGYLYNVFFPKIYNGARPVCSSVGELSSNAYAKRYSSASDSSGSAGNVSYCIPQGGIHMSVRQMARFAEVYGYSRTLIPRGSRERMEDAGSFKDGLVFNGAQTGDHFPEENRTQWFDHGGKYRGYRAVFIRLPQNHYGVALVNSPPITSDDLGHAMYYAYVYATVGLPAKISANDRHHFAYREGTYVTRGTSRAHEATRKFQRGSLIPGADFDDVFDISANDRMHFAWFKVRNPLGYRLLVSAGPSNDLDRTRELYESAIHPDFTLDELAFVSSNDEMHFAWYRRGNDLYVGAGASDDLDSRRPVAVRVTLSGGRTAPNVVAVASNDRMHFVFFDDCTYSAGRSDRPFTEREDVSGDCDVLQR